MDMVKVLRDVRLMRFDATSFVELTLVFLYTSALGI